MIKKTKGIILRQIKYSESSVIAHIYTEHFGRLSILINGVGVKRKSRRIKLLQPLSILDMEIYRKPSRDIQRVKEMSLHIPYSQIPFCPEKNAIALFISEILYKTLREQEANPALFEFLSNSLQILDIRERHFANFHLVFLMNLSKYLGFFPLDNFSDSSAVFDMMNGKYVDAVPWHPNFVKPPLSGVISRLQALNYENLNSLPLSGTQRIHLLEMLMDYYRLHIDNFGEVNSIKILHKVFH